MYSLGSEQPKFQTVTGLKNHLAKCLTAINDANLKRAAEHDENGRKRKKPKLDSVGKGASPTTSPDDTCCHATALYSLTTTTVMSPSAMTEVVFGK